MEVETGAAWFVRQADDAMASVGIDPLARRLLWLLSHGVGAQSANDHKELESFHVLTTPPGKNEQAQTMLLRKNFFLPSAWDSQEWIHLQNRKSLLIPCEI